MYMRSREDLEGLAADRTMRIRGTFSTIARVSRTREEPSSRDSSPTFHMEDFPDHSPPRRPRASRRNRHLEVVPDRPPRISPEGYSDTLSVEVQVNQNRSKNTSSLNLNGDHLTVSIPPPHVNTRISVASNDRKRRISSGSSSITTSSSSDFRPRKQFCKPKKAFGDFLRLFNNPDSFPDAILKCGTTEIPVHKCILSVRSPVFQALFKSQMKEGHDGVVDIVDIEPDVLEAMLKYMYGGQRDHINVALAEDLLFAADKYQIDGLKEACIKRLKTSVAKNNVLRILVLGDMHDASLKVYALGYITRFLVFSELEDTEEWRQLQAERSKLAMEVLNGVLRNLPRDMADYKNVRVDSITSCQT